MVRRLSLLLSLIGCCLIGPASSFAQVPPGAPGVNVQGGNGLPPGFNPQEAIQKMLAKYDTNGDGQLSPDETQRMGQGLINGDIPFPQPIVARFDVNGDGKLNPAERMAAVAAMQKMMSNNRPNNTTGPAVGGKPMPVAKKKTAKEKIKEKLDTNGDGKVSEEEREAARAKAAKAKEDYAKKVKAKGKKKDDADADEPKVDEDAEAEADEEMAAADEEKEEEKKPADKPAAKPEAKKAKAKADKK